MIALTNSSGIHGLGKGYPLMFMDAIGNYQPRLHLLSIGNAPLRRPTLVVTETGSNGYVMLFRNDFSPTLWHGIARDLIDALGEQWIRLPEAQLCQR